MHGHLNDNFTRFTISFLSLLPNLSTLTVSRTAVGTYCHWLSTSVSLSAFRSSDWPDYLLHSYATYFTILPNHINMHVNQNATLKMGGSRFLRNFGKLIYYLRLKPRRRHQLIHSRCESLKTSVNRHTKVVISRPD